MQTAEPSRSPTLTVFEVHARRSLWTQSALWQAPMRVGFPESPLFMESGR